METDFQATDLIGSVYQNGNITFFDRHLLASPIGNRLKVIDLKNDCSHTLQCQSNFNIVYAAFSPDLAFAVLINEVSVASLVLLQHNTVIYQRQIGRHVRCASFSPNSKYLAFGLDGVVAIYAVDQKGLSAEPLRLLQRRYFGNVATESAIKSVEWSPDSKLVLITTKSHVMKIYAPFDRTSRFKQSNLTDTSEIIGAFFKNDENYDIIIVNKRAKMCQFRASMLPADVWKPTEEGDQAMEVDRMRYKFDETSLAILYELFEGKGRPDVSAATFDRKSQQFAVGFDDSTVVVVNVQYEAPIIVKHLNLNINSPVQSLSLTNTHLAFAIGRGFSGSLYVWDIKSEIFVVKQQSHTKPILCAAYSPLGLHLATGGEDNLVKIWSAQSSMCVVTLKGHTASVTSLCFTENGNAILSASMDGKVIAHDMKRYRNFRTMVTPKQTQLEHLCADKSGQNCMASSVQNYEIYVWSIETGDLLEVLNGHIAPITGLSLHGLRLASVSMDKTLRVWDVIRVESEATQLSHEGVAVKFSPDGFFLVVLCLDSSVHVFDTRTNETLFLLETKLDIDSGRERNQALKKETIEKNKNYTCLEFSPSGNLLLIGGQSSMFSIYDFTSRSIIRRLLLSQNMSIEGTNPRFNPFAQFAVDPTDSDEETVGEIAAPGVARKDPSERAYRPSLEIRAFAFNPIGRSFAVVSTEGVLVYSVDNYRKFQPRRLVDKVTPKSVRDAIQDEKYHKALYMALILNDNDLVETSLNVMQFEKIPSVIGHLSETEASELLQWLSGNIARVGRMRVHRYFSICRELIYKFGHFFKTQLSFVDSITALQQYFHLHKEVLDLVHTNQGLLDYLTTVRKLEALQTS
ncbi:Utp12 domain-containing protein [Aphelenchoides bicaudatus]|nr:Utp12 domain-containing protein [Aphelenchoides bicaudatus]